ncbi:DUF5916 domain-containing protein [Flavisolibacter tropicus]|uniref:DUF5916 domain-containing protein n=1 Tax=Flavisolibacter tropicus TaxID=1492898 RepID=UPI000A4B655D|nr:DUF5916 domain-containing protein [Flavisolibacter tropicus]
MLLLGTCFNVRAFAQNVSRELSATRSVGPIKVDGILNETAWKEALPATHFIESRPYVGKAESEVNKTVVYLLYDAYAIYVGGTCYEPSKDSISRELVGRDKLGINDFISVAFDLYNDKINGVGFFVTPYGEQYDAKYSNSGDEDGSWNAVWDSEAKVHQDGWSFEMRIPYSALRYSKQPVQNWGLQITRRRTKAGQQLVWNPINPEINGFLNQAGMWKGIQVTKAPVRLSFSPYIASYINHNGTVDANRTSSSLTGGMDVKYGISQSFTLDMTLVPDFGQVKSDNKVLNLSPFEVRYEENRSFFTEGTELFNKGDLFYSRRIGQQPIHYYAIQDPLREEDHVQDNEVIISNPTESKLVNATKVSGRLHKGLGIGVFNAITQPMYAIVENDRGEKRKILTDPLTNYNITVLDQTLKGNSSISFINTNVSRAGKDYDANVSSALLNLNNKHNTFNFFGNFSLSKLFYPDYTLSGYAHTIRLAKTSGRFLVNVTQDLQDQKYNKNDLGINNTNNYLDHNLGISYNWWKPTSWYNQLSINSNAAYSRRYLQNDFQRFQVYFFVSAQLKNLWGVGSYVSYNPEGHDYYESRNGSLFINTASVGLHGWVETNRAKKYNGNAYYWVYIDKLFKARRYEFGLAHQYRFSDKFSLSQGINYYPYFNEAGYYSNYSNPGSWRTMPVLLFSKRDRNTVENTFQAKYNFNKRSGISLRVRHYWSQVEHKAFFDLKENGLLEPTVVQDVEVRNQNQNFFNIDMAYSMQFAPGSFINIVWKEASTTYNDLISSSYFSNFKSTVSVPQINNLSVKILYYLDCLALKKRRKLN